MQRKQLIKADLEKSGVNPGLVDDCLTVAEAIDDIDPAEGQFLTLSYFVEHQSVYVGTPRLVRALNFLCAMESPLLSVHGFLNSAEGPVVLEDCDFKNLLEKGELVHPEHGFEIRDPMTQVHLFYSIVPLGTDQPNRESA